MSLHTTSMEEEDNLPLDMIVTEEIEQQLDSGNVNGLDDQLQATSSCYIGCEESKMPRKNNHDAAEEDTSLKTSDTSLTVNVKLMKAETSGQICTTCQKHGVVFTHDSFLKNFCDSCYKFLYREKSECFLRNMNTCLPCKIPLCNNLSQMTHVCTRNNIYVCNVCIRTYKDKEFLIKHIEMAHNTYNQFSSSKNFTRDKFMTIKDIYESNAASSKLVTSGKFKIAKNFTYIKSHGAINNKNCRATKIFNQTGGSNVRAVDQFTSEKNSFCVTNHVKVNEKIKCIRIFNKDVHEMTYFSHKSHKCNVCGKKFSYACNLRIHGRTHSGIKPYKCNVCKKSFVQSSTLIVHKRIHSGIKLYECKVCKKSFLQSSYLNVHKRIHAGIKPYKCTVCDKSFCQSSELKVHTQTHSGLKPYKCNVCEKSFSLLRGLKLHEIRHSNIKRYKCNVCEKSFLLLNDLKCHQRIHSGIKPYKCNICEKSFSQGSHRKTHEITHYDIKAYTCDVCGKSFSQSYILKMHTRTHSGIKPYICNICEKSFSRSSHLKRHQRTHSGIKPYKCNDCEKVRAHLNSLKSHEKSHSGIKPYKCNVCEKSFSRSDVLKIHKKTHSGNKPYECNVCGKLFSQLRYTGCSI